jgi:hypothetical protein
MDEELQQLEAELKRLRPVAPRQELTARLAREFAAQPRRRTQWWWVALPAAAAVTLLLTNADRPDSTSTARPVVARQAPSRHVDQPAFKPVAAENVLLAARDEGLVTLADGSAARRIRESYLDTITWKDPRSQASLTWSVPREEERLVRVVFQ